MVAIFVVICDSMRSLMLLVRGMPPPGAWLVDSLCAKWEYSEWSVIIVELLGRMSPAKAEQFIDVSIET